MKAAWQVFEDKDRLWLQIELGNDFAVTLTIARGERPATTLWCGNGEHSFSPETCGDMVVDPGETRESFKQWLDEAAKEPACASEMGGTPIARPKPRLVWQAPPDGPDAA
jgi:hypothetical protein